MSLKGSVFYHLSFPRYIFKHDAVNTLTREILNAHKYTTLEWKYEKAYYAFKASFHVEPLILICLQSRIEEGSEAAWRFQKDI